MNTTDNPLVSFVVLSWNTLEDTKVCLNNLRELDYKNYEIIVVDNGSDDGSKNYLRTLKWITYVDLPRNTGFTGGEIAALDYCAGSFIALVNSDAVLAKNWTEKCLEVFLAIDNVGAVGGKAYTWPSHEAAFNTTLPFYSYQRVDAQSGYAETQQTGEEITEIDSISGAAVMISRDAINTAGYFDNSFFAYYEETDLFSRFQRAGYKIMYQPEAHAWHQIAKSTKSKPYFYLYHMHRNRCIYGVKNFDRIGKFVLNYALDGLRAGRHYYMHGHDIDNRARWNAFVWNAFHIPIIMWKRHKVQKLGKSYFAAAKERAIPRDVTIVIPSYNYEMFLSQAIESALNQTTKPFKIIVIDDGSKDSSIEIAKRFAGVELVEKSNEGVIKTKNLGISLSTTTWTIFLDADDKLDNNYIEKLLDEAEREKSDVVYTDVEFFGSVKGRSEAGEFTVARLLDGNFVHNSALIRTNALKISNGYKQEMSKGYEDWELYVTLAEQGCKFSYCKNTVLYYRQHDNSLGRNYSAIKASARLYENVKRLHAFLYESHSPAPEKSKLSKIFLQIKSHPSVLVVAVLYIPYAALLGPVKNYLLSAKTNYVHMIRTYLHNKNHTNYS